MLCDVYLVCVCMYDGWRVVSIFCSTKLTVYCMLILGRYYHINTERSVLHRLYLGAGKVTDSSGFISVCILRHYSQHAHVIQRHPGSFIAISRFSLCMCPCLLTTYLHITYSDLVV